MSIKFTCSPQAYAADDRVESAPISTGLKALAALPADQLAATARRIVEQAATAANGDSATTPTITETDGGGKIPGFSPPKPIGQLIEEYKNGGGLEPDWILEGYLPAGGLVLLAGSPKAGKTTLAAHIAVHVDQGLDFLGFKTKKTGVLWMGLEERGQDVARRFDELGNWTVFYHPAPFRATTESIRELVAWIKGNGVGLVIVDTLSKFWDLKDENDAAGMERAIDPILRLARDSGAAILLLHHTRKTPADDGSDIRGSSALFGSLDVGIIFRTVAGAGNSSRRSLRTFSRYSETPEKLEADLREGAWVLSDHCAAKIKTNTHDAALLAALTPEPEDVTTIAKRANLAYSTARRGLLALHESKPSAIRKSGGDKKGDPGKFCAVPQDAAGMLPPPSEALGTPMVAESPALFADDADADRP